MTSLNTFMLSTAGNSSRSFSTTNGWRFPLIASGVDRTPWRSYAHTFESDRDKMKWGSLREKRSFLSGRFWFPLLLSFSITSLIFSNKYRSIIREHVCLSNVALPLFWAVLDIFLASVFRSLSPTSQQECMMLPSARKLCPTLLWECTLAVRESIVPSPRYIILLKYVKRLLPPKSMRSWFLRMLGGRDDEYLQKEW